MASVTLKNIEKIYTSAGGDIKAVENFCLEIEDREFIVLVGPSGCGKSTVLRMIAGLEDITEGDLLIGGCPANHLAAKDRDIAMVFQNYALYPHMNVYKNMEFGLKMRRVDKREIRERILKTAKQLQIEDLLKRRPAELSGGQRQRVALGRAMVRQPQVFLLDEPLSNLDAKLRTEMRVQISHLHRQLQTTFIYVTHDQTEAMTMADRIVVMKDGIIQQVDSPRNIYQNPANLFVAGFIGSPRMNFFPAVLRTGENGGLCAEFSGQRFALMEKRFERQIPGPTARILMTAGIRPEDLHVHCGGESGGTDGGQSVLGEAELLLREDLGAEQLLYFRLGDVEITAKLPLKPELQNAQAGQRFQIRFRQDRLHLFEEDGGRAVKIN